MSIRSKKGNMHYAPIGQIWLAFGVIRCASCKMLLVDPDVECCLYGDEYPPLTFGYRKLEHLPPDFESKKDGTYLCKNCTRGKT